MKPYRRNGHIFSYPDRKVACDSPVHNGKKLWHNATKKVQFMGEMPSSLLEVRKFTIEIVWTFIKGILFAGLFMSLVGGPSSPYATVSGLAGLLYFMWAMIGKVMAGRWKILIKIFTERRVQYEVEEFGPR